MNETGPSASTVKITTDHHDTITPILARCQRIGWDVTLTYRNRHRNWRAIVVAAGVVLQDGECSKFLVDHASPVFALESAMTQAEGFARARGHSLGGWWSEVVTTRTEGSRSTLSASP
jgi:hypothetical protein